MASDLKGVVREEKRQYLVRRRKRRKAKGRNCSYLGENNFQTFQRNKIISNTYMILRASVIRNSPLPMRCVPKLDCNHPIVFSKKSDKPLFFVYLVIFIHSFISFKRIFTEVQTDHRSTVLRTLSK